MKAGVGEQVEVGADEFAAALPLGALGGKSAGYLADVLDYFLNLFVSLHSCSLTPRVAG